MAEDNIEDELDPESNEAMTEDLATTLIENAIELYLAEARDTELDKLYRRLLGHKITRGIIKSAAIGHLTKGLANDGMWAATEAAQRAGLTTPELMPGLEAWTERLLEQAGVTLMKAMEAFVRKMNQSKPPS